MLASLFSLGLLASSALAIPTSAERMEARIARRRGGEARLTQPMTPAPGSQLEALAQNASHVSYSSNWAGAVISKTTVRFLVTFGGKFYTEGGGIAGYMEVRYSYLYCSYAEEHWRLECTVRLGMGWHRR
jgi:hypothetical protein